jgi:cytochrome c553
MTALCHSRLWLFIGLSLSALFGAADAFCQTTPEKAPDTIEARLLACAPCHGPVGEGTNNAYFPRLAGKPAGYLTNQLVAFRNGRRRYPPMNYLLEYLPEDYLVEMANYFAAQTPPLPAPVAPDVSQELMRLGEQLI